MCGRVLQGFLALAFRNFLVAQEACDFRAICYMLSGLTGQSGWARRHFVTCNFWRLLSWFRPDTSAWSYFLIGFMARLSCGGWIFGYSSAKIMFNVRPTEALRKPKKKKKGKRKERQCYSGTSSMFTKVGCYKRFRYGNLEVPWLNFKALICDVILIP